MRYIGQTFILEIISTIFMIISCILAIIQSFDNYNFKYFKTIKSTTERLLFEQFSYEVFSNIKSYAFTKTYDSEVVSGEAEMDIEIKGNYIYDCKDVFDGELNEEYCQNKVVSSSTCCRPECCIRTNNDTDNLFCYNYVFDEIPTYDKILLYNDEEMLEDPRKKFCTYYNSYSGTMGHRNLYNTNPQIIYKYKYNYEEILYGNCPQLCIGYCDQSIYNYYCGIIDTKGKSLYATNSNICPIMSLNDISNDYQYYNFENYNEKIIIRSIISEEPPNNHEWKYKKVSNDYRKKKNAITIKDIKKLLKTENSINIYKKLGEINLNNLNNFNKGYMHGNYRKKKFYYYFTNYIGFADSGELRTFRNFFDENDPKNNQLYRIGYEIYPSVESIVIGFVLMSLFLIYLIIFFIYSIKKFEERKKGLKILYIIKQILLFLAFLEELGIYIWMTRVFKNINIEMDVIYKEILNLYNNRRFQLLYLLSIIFFAASLLFSIIGLIFYFTTKNAPNIINTENERMIPNVTNNNTDHLINNNENNINNANTINNVKIHKGRKNNNQEDEKSEERKLVNDNVNNNVRKEPIISNQ